MVGLQIKLLLDFLVDVVERVLEGLFVHLLQLVLDIGHYEGSDHHLEKLHNARDKNDGHLVLQDFEAVHHLDDRVHP